jgi:hypothetical protein
MIPDLLLTIFNMESKMKLLHGHVSPETAYVVEDYPYGFRLRCKCRFWIEKPNKGAGKGKYRAMTQTTDPKFSFEKWNKPKSGVYMEQLFLYQDESDGHTKFHGFSEYYQVKDVEETMKMFEGQFTEEEKVKLNSYYQIALKVAERMMAKGY